MSPSLRPFPVSFAFRIEGFVLLCGGPEGFGSQALFGAGLLLRNAGDSGEERRGEVVRGVECRQC